MKSQSGTQRDGSRVGAVGLYVAGDDVDLVRRARERTGRVTVCGRPGQRVITKLARADDVGGVDLDPGVYVDHYRAARHQLAFLDVDWEQWQHDARLPVVRSAGVYANRADHDALKEAFTTPIRKDTTRVVSAHSWWLRSEGFRVFVSCVRNCDDPLAFVFADMFDPLADTGTVDRFRSLLEVACAGRRPVELLRSDLTAIGCATLGGSLGTIGLSTYTRHHGLPLPRKAAKQYNERHRTPYVFVPALLSWHKGTDLGALAKFDGAGITNCDCQACQGADLLRFDREWPRSVPAGVLAEAREHDMHTVTTLAKHVLAAPDPEAKWRRACALAVKTAGGIASVYKVVLHVPDSIRGWA